MFSSSDFWSLGPNQTVQLVRKQNINMAKHEIDNTRGNTYVKNIFEMKFALSWGFFCVNTTLESMIHLKHKAQFYFVLLFPADLVFITHQ